MNTNFGFNFGVPRSTGEGNDSQSQSQTQSQSQDYSIDLDQITPPTFRFGQFGQVESSASKIEMEDDDSFLAEPSISVSQFDANFNFTDSLESSQYPGIIERADNPDSISKSTSNSSVPTLIEEPLEEPDYLEEPAPHSVEELLKATVDGSGAEFVLNSSWENVGIEEIEAAQAEFDVTKEIEIEKLIEDKIEMKSKNLIKDEEKVEIEKSAKPVKLTKKSKLTKTSNSVKSTKPSKTVDETVILKSKRERTTVDRLAETPLIPSKVSNEKISKGSGKKLGEIEIIEKNLNKKLASDKIVTLLHRIIFDRVGEARTRKSNIRSFCGFNSENNGNLESKLQKLTVVDLKELANLLALSGASNKATLVKKISEFLIKPVDEIVKRTTMKATTKTTKKRTRAATPVTKKKTKTFKSEKNDKFLSPEIIEDSDVESEVEREVLDDLKYGK